MKLKNIVFTLVLFLSVLFFNNSCFAAEYDLNEKVNEALNSIDYTYEKYFIVHQGDLTFIHVLASNTLNFNNSPTNPFVKIHEVNYYTGKYKIYVNYLGEKYYHINFRIDNSGNLNLMTTKEVSESASISELSFVHEVLYSEVNIYNYNDGSLFFQAPPVVEEEIPNLTLEEMTAALMTEETPKMAQTVVGTMKVLVLCGVGLIALLVGLGLFGKVFRIFQVK